MPRLPCTGASRATSRIWPAAVARTMLKSSCTMRAHGVALLGLAIVGCGTVTPLDADGGAGATGSGGVGGSAAGGSGGTGTGGTAGGMGGAGGSGGSPLCPPNQIWCPGCTPGTGMCSPGGCPGFACPPPDAGSMDARSPCSSATSAADCDARTSCHSVFVDPHTCGCALLGCCAHFSVCVEGAQAVCKNATLICNSAPPYCEGPYVIAYSNGCYEGCVRMAECAP